MKIRFLKDHGFNKKDTVNDLPDGAANYLIRVGVAIAINDINIIKEDFVDLSGDTYTEKVEHEPAKEKKENKTGNVPTARKKKTK